VNEFSYLFCSDASGGKWKAVYLSIDTSSAYRDGFFLFGFDAQSFDQLLRFHPLDLSYVYISHLLVQDRDGTLGCKSDFFLGSLDCEV
jgi:hypothetical protein